MRDDAPVLERGQGTCGQDAARNDQAMARRPRVETTSTSLASQRAVRPSSCGAGRRLGLRPVSRAGPRVRPAGGAACAGTPGSGSLRLGPGLLGARHRGTRTAWPRAPGSSRRAGGLHDDRGRDAWSRSSSPLRGCKVGQVPSECQAGAVESHLHVAFLDPERLGGLPGIEPFDVS